MATPKVILQLYPMFPADGEEGRKAQRPLGNNSETYNKIVHEWDEVVVEADKMGVWGVSTIEHHLHSEGYEVGPNPGVLNARWSTLVKNANIGALGYVAATQDPIRVAEETAIIDYMCNGRYFVGFARGYQACWTNILGQFSGAEATVSDKSEADHYNRKVFEERVEQIIAAWTQESIAFDGDSYKAPFPKETGVQNYPAWRITAEAGAPGEVDDKGNIRRVCVVPKPYQRPHPPVMVAASKSPESIQFCARNRFIPTYFMHTLRFVEMARLYVKEGARHGIDYALGQNQNIVRWPHITKSREEYLQRLRDYDLDIYKNFYGPFFPQFPQSADESEYLSSMEDSGIFISGTVEESIRQWRELYDLVPSEYITLIWHWAQVLKEVMMEELQLFMDKVLPELEIPDFKLVPMAAE
jgi:alkanesulfonate monooxygenase SsuD/methylene tetrahydromethanopterin reductase-like flavin-dependent oxidoreductase (luciferase family)